MIHAFDIATRLTGYCSGTGDKMPEAGVLEFPQVGDDLGKLGSQFSDQLERLFTRLPPTAVIYEAPIKLRTDKLSTLRHIYGMGMVLETVCVKYGVGCFEVDLRDIKREVTGNPSAEKDDMVAVARKVGLRLPPGPAAKDATDAWGAWLLGVRKFNKPASARWDRLVRSPRGALL